MTPGVRSDRLQVGHHTPDAGIGIVQFVIVHAVFEVAIADAHHALSDHHRNYLPLDEGAKRP